MVGGVLVEACYGQRGFSVLQGRDVLLRFRIAPGKDGVGGHIGVKSWFLVWLEGQGVFGVLDG